jgi:hypothetical protein
MEKEAMYTNPTELPAKRKKPYMIDAGAILPTLFIFKG